MKKLLFLLLLVLFVSSCQKSQSEIYETNDADALRDAIAAEDAQWDPDWAVRAIQEDRTELLKVWLDRFERELTQLDKDALLHMAAQYRSPGATRELLQHGADPNGLYYSATPLCQAVSLTSFGEGKPMLPVVKVLVEGGALVNDQGRYKRPFVEAASYADADTVTYLVEQGAFVNSGLPLGSSSPLGAAVMFNSPDVVKVLLDSGAEPERLLYYGAILSENTDVLRFLSQVDPHSQQGLLYAMESITLPGQAKPGMVRQLLEFGMDPNKSERDLLAVFILEKNEEMVELCLKHGARPRPAAVMACLETGQTERLSELLKEASPSLNRFAEFAGALFEQDLASLRKQTKADFKLVSTEIDEDTLVEWSIRKGRPKMAEMLLELGAQSSWTAVQFALEDKPEPAFIKRFLAGLDWREESYDAELSRGILRRDMPQLVPDAVSREGSLGPDPVPLVELVREQDVEALMEALSSGADPNEREADFSRPTPLHLAAAADSKAEEMVELLLSYEADVAARDLYGLTPVYYANPDSAVARILLRAGAPKEDWELARLVRAIGEGTEYEPASDISLVELAARSTDSTDYSFAKLESMLGSDLAKTLDGKLPSAGKQPLALAFEQGAAKIALQLLEAGAEPGPALQEALGYGDPELVQTLIDKGALKDERVFVELAQHFAFRGDLAQQALDFGGDPNKQLPTGERALVEAARVNELMGIWLLEHGADPSLPDKEGKYPLQESLHGHRFDKLASMLIDAGAPLDKKDRWKKTPLNSAADLSSPSLLKQMIAHGGHPDQKLKEQIRENPYLKHFLDEVVSVE